MLKPLPYNFKKSLAIYNCLPYNTGEQDMTCRRKQIFNTKSKRNNAKLVKAIFSSAKMFKEVFWTIATSYVNPAKGSANTEN